MHLSDSEEEQTDKYVLDLPNTLYSNIIVFLILFVAIIYISLFNKMIESFISLPQILLTIQDDFYLTILLIDKKSSFYLQKRHD